MKQKETDRQIPCIYGGLCNQGKNYNYSCAKCSSYKLRVRERQLNKKKKEFEKIWKKERY